MQTAQFLVRTSEAGLPHALPIGQAVGGEVLHGLSAGELANAYWLLRAISVDYAYEFSTYGTISNSYSVERDEDPPQRLIQPPTFIWSGYNSQFSLDTVFEMVP